MRLISRTGVAIVGAILVLSTFAIAPVLAVGPTTHFSIVGLNASETAGVNDTITVNALDATEAVDTTFAGTISFSSSDGLAILPANGSSLTAGTGTADFVVQFHFSGPQTLTVTQNGSGTQPTGTASTTVNPAAATHFTVSGFANPVVAGVSGGVDVSAIDAFNNVDTKYAGTIHLTSSDSAAILPVDTTTVNGQVSYTNNIALRTAGTQSITATDTVTSSITGSQVGITVTPAAPDHLSVTGFPSPTTAGVAHPVTVTARDTFNNVATGYTGTVAITSSDGTATLPGNHAYTGGENGVHAFSVTLNSVGAGRTIIATDTVTSSITGTQAGITVSAANVAPVAVADSATIATGSGYTAINVLANDTDANSDVLHVASATAPSHGTVIIPGGGANITYRPTAGFVGTDTFTYKANDGALDSNSAIVTVHVTLDGTPPVATAPFQTFSVQVIGTSTARIRLAWSGTDVGLGIARYEVWQSTNGGTWTKITTTTLTSTYVTGTIGTSYRFRVRAIDKASNVGAFAYGPTFKLGRYQETSTTIVYSSPWANSTNAVFSGGTDKSTSHAGFTATFTVSARTFAWVTAKGPTRGTADVFVDGVLKAHLTLTASTATYRYLAYSTSFTSSALHAVRIVYTGPTTKRVDVDAFMIMR